MKLSQLSTLSAAIMLATTAQANSFVDDSSLNIELRNHFQERSKEQDKETSSSQWAQAIRADFTSGYFENIVGIDLSAYYALKLGASNIDSADPGVLPSDDDGDSRSFGKTAYAIKFNLMDMGVAKYGRMQLDTPLINNSDDAALPSLTEGFYADVAYEGLTAHAVWATKANEKTNSSFTDYKTGDNKEPVKAVGGAYDFGNGLGLSADYATQDDFSKRYLTEATYSTEMNGTGIDLAAQYAKSSNIGDAKNTNDDNSQTAWGIKANASIQQATFGLAYTKVENTDFDKYNSHWAGGSDDDTDYFGYNAVQHGDFNRNGQKAIGLNAGYGFTGMVDGLSVNAAYVTSDFKDSDGNKLDEKEYNIKITYAVPQIEGLTAQLRYAENTTEKDSAKDTVTKDTRIIIKYNVAVF